MTLGSALVRALDDLLRTGSLAPEVTRGQAIRTGLRGLVIAFLALHRHAPTESGPHLGRSDSPPSAPTPPSHQCHSHNTSAHLGAAGYRRSLRCWYSC